ncbi:N-acetylmuramoyl-L-alanine amidase family 2 [Kribbella flavida DSM 17836]|uniref:N-acetylmuramoyl-L-alanine amidase family 2 n=1 Tax=Kribbella flavida (strain DSM 17836 / JCM 10339 / NBRC 14399) TaxID=479435 RepID=D2PUL2_KRIFD|nr:N-acetylmuramoyl-L-alanine amidase [Kribbella flavida]ADB29530.1 N-acetylmuramoyl-L-alanine amidase family 2 [Kribbella flavida DSM 17836]
MAAITWLADVLRGAGLQVIEEGDWRRRAVAGSFAPIGVLWHHTAATSSPENPAPALATVIAGRPELEGPLCHALVDYNGVFHVIAAGRANHAGETRPSGPIPAGDGNALLVGWEIDYDGQDQVMTPQQYTGSVRATAAVLRQLGRDASYARGHLETSTTGKIDPHGVDLDRMRADVAAQLAGGGTATAAFHARWTDGTWTPFRPLGMAVKDVAVAGTPDGRAQVAVIGVDDVVYHRLRNSDGTWTEFGFLTGFGGPAKGRRVSIAGMEDGTSQVVITGTDGASYHSVRRTDGTWTPFGPLGMVAKDVAIAGMPDGLAQVAVIGTDDVVYHRVRDSDGTWTKFGALAGFGGPAKGKSVSIAGLEDGTSQVVITGTDGASYHSVRRTDGTWTPFRPLGMVAKDVAITGMPDGRAQVAVIGIDDVVYHRVRDSDGTWTKFEALAGFGGPAKGRAVSIAGSSDRTSEVVINAV